MEYGMSDCYRPINGMSDCTDKKKKKVSDCQRLLSDMEQKKEELTCKRRLLMGLPHSECFSSECEYVPESLLRRDDVFYEDVVRCIEERFETHTSGRPNHQLHNSMLLPLKLHNNVVGLTSYVDDFTNEGLCKFAEILTGGSLNFEKTRGKVKKVVMESLEDLEKTGNHQKKLGLLEQLPQILKDPRCFGCFTPEISAQCHHGSVKRVLNRLKSKPSQTLHAMYRKLKGVSPCNVHESGWSQKRLKTTVKKTCEEMLRKRGEGDVLQEPLAKAMEIFNLSAKLYSGNWNSSVAEFYQYSQDLKALQNDIIKAIRLLEKTRMPELKNLQLILGLNTETSNRSLRPAIRNLLTQYLYEYDDFNLVPNSLKKALAIINKGSPSPKHKASGDQIQEEVEIILSISANTKQMLWDLLDCELEQDYGDAYMENLKESDEITDYGGPERHPKFCGLQTIGSHFTSSNELLEGIGESNNLGNVSSHLNTLYVKLNGDSMGISESDLGSAQQSKFLNNKEMLVVTLDCMVETAVTDCNSIGYTTTTGFSSQNGNMTNEHHKSTSRNGYLAIQNICDQMSMVTYQLVARTIELLAEGLDLGLNAESHIKFSRHTNSLDDVSQTTSQNDVARNAFQNRVKDSVILLAVEELIPSLPESTRLASSSAKGKGVDPSTSSSKKSSKLGSSISGLSC